MVLIAVFLGCGNQPLDVLISQSDKSTTDIVSEVSDCFTGLDVDTMQGEYRATFDKACVDTVLGVVPSTATTSLSDIVSDTGAGGDAYEGQILTVTGTVKEQLSSAITLETENDSVTFFVRSWGTGDRLTGYEVGETHTFDLYIQDQALAFEANDDYNVWTDLVSSAEAEAVTLHTLTTHAQNENQQYAQRVITFDATVSSIGETAIFLRDNADNVIIQVSLSGHADEADYQVNQSYTFTVFVFKIGEWVIDNWYEVRLGTVRSE